MGDDGRGRSSKPFKCGWFGDGGLGERLIQSILTGHKSATVCPAYDPDDAELQVGDTLRLTDKFGLPRGTLIVTRAEVRAFKDFDDDLARRAGTTLHELKSNLQFANSRNIKPEEEMRIIHFEILRSAGDSQPEAPHAGRDQTS